MAAPLRPASRASPVINPVYNAPARRCGKLSWHAYVAALIVVGGRAAHLKVDRVLPSRVRRWIRHPWFDYWLFLAAFGVCRVFSPSVHESAIWGGFALGAAMGLLQRYR
jgi:hypothetical protein